MLLWTLALPHSMAYGALAKTGLPVMIIFPVGTLLLGKLMLNRYQRISTVKALRESEEKFRNIFENAVEGFYQSTPEGRFTSVNPAFVRMFGYASAEELVSSQFDIYRQFYVNPEDRTRWQRTLQDQGTVKKYECQAKRKDGSHFWISDSTRAVFDSHGNVLRYEGNVSDITARKEAEAARIKTEAELVKRNQFIETILNHLPIGLAVNSIGADKATYVNQKFEEIYGWPKEEIENLDDFFEKIYPDKEYRQQIKSRVSADIQSGDPQKMEWEGVAATGKNGRKTIILAKNIPLYEQNMMISTVQDITESKTLQTRLQQAQKMEAIGNLAGGIAHDFNNILFPIMGFSELLMADLPPGSPEHGNAREIFKASERGRDLVKQILAFGRQSQKTLMPVLIQQVLKDVLKLSRSTIPSNIEIKQEIQSDCGRVLADPTQLHQIAMNLITNAYHAVEPQGGEISVQLREIELDTDDWAGSSLEQGKYAMLTVADTGCGIDPTLKNRIFDPYFTTKAQGRGTGLGLAVVHGIVKDCNGEIKVTSEVGQGTTFNVFIPLVPKDIAIAEFKKAEPLEGGTERILLVDDEKVIVNLQANVLERLGYRVTCRTSSVEALEAFKANPDAFDLLITDMAMPNMTGDLLAKAVKSIKPHLPVIICTGFSERINRERAQAIGVNGFLMKPVIRSQLAGMVRNVLDENARASAAPVSP
jgi:PAS domain S-box-containing protein